MKTTRIVIMAKAPVPGYAKTRLIPALGLEGSAELAQRLLRHTINEALQAQTGLVELCVSPSINDLIWNQFDIPSTVDWSEQGEGDLGERLARVAQRVTENNEHVLLIGTDCPDLRAENLIQAVEVLHQYDACMVPVIDGGYALLGLRSFSPAVFADIPWSTDKVAEISMKKIKALEWSLKIFQPLRDIDTPADLAILSKHGFNELHINHSAPADVDKPVFRL